MMDVLHKWPKKACSLSGLLTTSKSTQRFQWISLRMAVALDLQLKAAHPAGTAHRKPYVSVHRSVKSQLRYCSVVWAVRVFPAPAVPSKKDAQWLYELPRVLFASVEKTACMC